MIDLLSTQEKREVLKWACAFVGSPEVNHCRKWRPHEYDACRAVSDPAELAKMWSAEIERLQLDIPSERAHGSWYSVSSYLVDGIEIAKYGWVSQVKPMTDSTRSHWKWSFPGHRIIPLVKARSILAVWLALKDGEREVAEQALKVEP